MSEVFLMAFATAIATYCLYAAFFTETSPDTFWGSRKWWLIASGIWFTLLAAIVRF